MFTNTVKPYQIFGLLVLLGISLAFFRLAMAIAAFTPRAQPTGYVAQPDVTNYNLVSGNEVIFLPDYEREFWSGNLYAYPVSETGAVNFAGEKWTLGAANSIEAQNWDTQRLIATMKDTGSGIPFRYTSLSVAQRAYFPATTINLFAATGAQIVDFLRGDRSNEGPESLRIRNYTLGDIIHSRPYYVADPTYPTVFVGANDGMLHAINANDGSERWAYVPSMLLPKMINLAKPYGGVSNPHDYFMDGQIIVGTIDVSGTPRRILVGMLGAGGKGLFALNIDGSAGLNATDEVGVAGKVMWEINGASNKLNYAAPSNATAYLNLGYTYGIPALAKVKTGAATSSDAVIIGNGYNDNAGGDYQARLYMIDALTGQLINSVVAGTSGTAASPNGLSTVAPVDTEGDGVVDRIYAGDLNGSMWKFSADAGGIWTATLLYTTSPAQPITGTPGVGVHPNGGYMVNFGTGSMFTDATTDSTTYYVYGIWDGAVGGNIITQSLEERTYTPDNGITNIRVRRVLNAKTLNWATDKGWKVPLPVAGERVVGDGGFTENGRFYFNTHNPTQSILIPDPCVLPGCANQTPVYGENWLMELDYLTGGTANDPFLDLDGNLLLNNDDRIKYLLSDLPTLPDVVGDPIRTTNGIPVGKFLGNGAISQPLLVQLRTLNTTLFTSNPDIVFPYNEVGFGVTGGHFDEDIYHNCTLSGSPAVPALKATATITVGTSGQAAGYPATLGTITVDGFTIVPALTTTEITDGTSTGANAVTIRNKVTGGYTASVAGNVITITAPIAGTSYNGKTIVINDGTASGIPPGSPVNPTGLITFAGGATSRFFSAKLDKTLSGNTQSVVLGGYSYGGPITIGKSKTPAQAASAVVSAIGTGGSVKAYIGGNSVTPTCAAQTNNVVCLVDTTTTTNGTPVSIGNFTNPGTVTVSTTATAGGAPGTPGTGWSNFKPALTTTAFSGGADAVASTAAATCSAMTTWKSKSHTHQYDDKFDKTGVDMLNASVTALNLYNAIPTATTQFKVIAHNQYLSPAVKINIGRTDYQYNIDFGYTPIKDFTVSPTLNTASELAALPIYTLNNVGSLVINMPIDALSIKDWHGNGDMRAGLHPTVTGCVNKAAGATDGNMYQPVIPPADGVDGPGMAGWNTTTTPLTATGARHNGALTIQIIKATTPTTALEMNIPGRPAYGWRVKSADYNTYVLAEYTTFWHHPNGKCYGNAGWTKAPPPDESSSTPSTPATGSTDPKLGDLSGGGGTVASVSRETVGNVTTTTITYTSGLTATITRTKNTDGSVRIVTCDALGTCQTQDIAAAKGTLGTGGDERGLQAKTGRISWRELIAE